MLGSGLGFPQSDLGAIGEHFRVSQSVSCLVFRSWVSLCRFWALLKSVLVFLDLFGVLISRLQFAPVVFAAHWREFYVFTTRFVS